MSLDEYGETLSREDIDKAIKVLKDNGVKRTEYHLYPGSQKMKDSWDVMYPNDDVIVHDVYPMVGEVKAYLIGDEVLG